MAKNKTVETQNPVTGFLATVKDEKKRSDCLAIIELIRKHTGLEPKMWGSGIVGFASYYYKLEDIDTTVLAKLAIKSIEH